MSSLPQPSVIFNSRGYFQASTATKYTDWKPLSFKDLKKDDQLKRKEDTSEVGVLTIERRVLANAYVNEVQEQLDEESILIIDENGLHGLLTEEDLIYNDALYRSPNLVNNSLMGDSDKPKIEKDGKWNAPCKYCSEPGYFDQVWGRQYCSAKCKDSYKG